jgi:hypothetical protein
VSSHRSGLGFALLVAAQLAIPAAYYLRQTDRDDERFAWRMFSAIRFRSCELVARERVGTDERALDLGHALHASWVGLLRRGRRSVIEEFLDARCAQPALTAASLLRSCREVDGAPGPRQQFRMDCRTRQLSMRDEGP